MSEDEVVVSDAYTYASGLEICINLKVVLVLRDDANENYWTRNWGTKEGQQRFFRCDRTLTTPRGARGRIRGDSETR